VVGTKTVVGFRWLAGRPVRMTRNMMNNMMSVFTIVRPPIGSARGSHKHELLHLQPAEREA